MTARSLSEHCAKCSDMIAQTSFEPCAQCWARIAALWVCIPEKTMAALYHNRALIGRQVECRPQKVVESAQAALDRMHLARERTVLK